MRCAIAIVIIAVLGVMLAKLRDKLALSAHDDPDTVEQDADAALLRLSRIYDHDKPVVFQVSDPASGETMVVKLEWRKP